MRSSTNKIKVDYNGPDELEKFLNEISKSKNQLYISLLTIQICQKNNFWKNMKNEEQSSFI